MLKLIRRLAAAAFLTLAALAVAQAANLPLFTSSTINPANLGDANAIVNAVNNNVAAYFAPSLTPAATAAAIQTVEQTFTVTGLLTTDKLVVNGPAPTSLCPPTTFRVSAANTIAIGFTTLTAAACTPAAGVYNIVAVH